MRKKNDTVRYSAKQIKTRIARGEDRTNWDKIDAVTGTKLEASIRADVDDIRAEPDWMQAIAGIPGRVPVDREGLPDPHSTKRGLVGKSHGNV
jgi:hypothetical protein